MPNEFWQALILFLGAGAGLLTALRERAKRQKVTTKAASEVREAKLEAELARREAELATERKEAAERERIAAADALEFRERLRQEAIAERGILEDRIEDLAGVLRETTSVMERSTDLAERVLDIEFGQRDATARTRSTDGAAPRRGPAASPRRPNRSGGINQRGKGQD